jgi:hypothetical protein
LRDCARDYGRDHALRESTASKKSKYARHLS